MFFLLPLLRFPLQLFRQLDPPRSLSAFLRNMLLVVARPLQDTDSQSGFPALRLQSAAVPSSPALSFSQRPFPNRARSRCVCHQDTVMGWRLSSIPTRLALLHLATEATRTPSVTLRCFLDSWVSAKKQKSLHAGAVFQRRAAPSASFHLGGQGSHSRRR